MVEKISKISASAAPIATRIEHSISVAEPEIAWAARRQAEIDEGLEDRRKSGEHLHPESNAEDADSRHLDLHHSESPEQTDDAEKLSALEALEDACEDAGVPCAVIGVVGGDTIKFVDVEEWEADRFDGLSEVALADLRRAHEAFLPELMGADGALA